MLHAIPCSLARIARSLARITRSLARSLIVAGIARWMSLVSLAGVNRLLAWYAGVALVEAAGRRVTAAKLSSAGAALVSSDHAASLRRLEALHKIELERAKATVVAAREKDQLELDRLVDLSKRLRSERNQAR